LGQFSIGITKEILTVVSIFELPKCIMALATCCQMVGWMRPSVFSQGKLSHFSGSCEEVLLSDKISKSLLGSRILP
jgi:hypothetical protein